MQPISAICYKTLNDLGGTAKRPTGAWGWIVLLTTPKLEDSLGGATRRVSSFVILFGPLPTGRGLSRVGACQGSGL